MGFLEVFILAIGLSMDAFAIAVCKGLNMKMLNLKQGFVIAFMFGFFQLAMPMIGYFFCSPFESYIQSFDHWIIFCLLSFIGLKMIIDCIKEIKSNKKEKTNLEHTNSKSENAINEKDGATQNEKLVVTTNEVTIDKQNIASKSSGEKLKFGEVLSLAFATSIDALAVGITFAIVDVNIFTSCIVIGIVTLVLCFIGVIIGNFFGSKIKSTAEILGGCILILIGLKILLEHLGVLIF